MKKVGIVACSNSQLAARQLNEDTCRVLEEAGMTLRRSPCIYSDNEATYADGKTRAEALMDMFRDPEITEIIDISGGDLANDVLDHLDYAIIAASPARFWGYSDLTTVINSIYAKTGKSSILYQVKNLVREETGGRLWQFQAFHETGDESLFNISCHFLRGSSLEGVMVGGNIRCLLKLAGTPYFPDMTGKILLLEALGAEVPNLVAYLAQYRQLGVFDKISGIVLGTFTAMEEKQCTPTVEELVLKMTPPHLPIVKTPDVGHYLDAKAVVIGKHYCFEA